MIADRTPTQVEVGRHGRGQVTACFDGGRSTTTEGGGLLLRETDARVGLLERIASRSRDDRNPSAVEHTVQDLVSQRVYGLALGYEGLNDHSQLNGAADAQVGRHWSGSSSDTAQGSSSGERIGVEPSGAVAAGGGFSERYKRIPTDSAALDRLLVDLFLEAHEEAPAEPGREGTPTRCR